MIKTLKTEDEFYEAIIDSTIATVHFQSDWAEQCHQVNELLETLGAQSFYSNIKFYSMAAEEFPEIALKYKIEAVPTVVLFQNGTALETIQGVNTEKIIEVLQKYSTLSCGESVIPINDRLKTLVNRSKIMVFMKGDRNEPRCGFSRQLIEILNNTGVSYDTFDILRDEEVRQGLKTYSNWPTYPQLYVKGELIGGLDIIKELIKSGEFVSTLVD